MTSLYFRKATLIFWVGIVALLLGLTRDIPSQEGVLTKFSGRVIDEAGHPITGLTVAIIPVEDGNGAWFPVEVDGHDWPDDPMAFQAETEAEGRFVITDAITGSVLLGLFPYYKPEAQILKVQIGGMSLYPGGGAVGGGTVFTLEPGEYIENVEITVRQFLQLRAKVLKMDGNPLANAERINFTVRQLGLDGEYDGSTSWTTETDAEGNFVQYIPPYVDRPMFYFMSVTGDGGNTQLDPIVVRPADLMHEAIFTFEAPLIPDAPGNAPRRLDAGGGIAAKGVWVVNPANGHAYKKIRFSGVEDAITQAGKENAYLVAINDAAEQNWLEQVFVAHRVLIGLSDVEKEGHWQWHSGEPVTYTNWARDEPNDTGKGDEDYVILFANQWVDIGPADVRWRFVQSVLLEKEETSLKK